MKKLTKLATALLLTLSLIVPLVGCGKEYAAPNFTVLDSSESEVELYDLIDKPIVLNFWATWCYYCKIEMPHFEDAAKKYGDIRFMMVNYTDGRNETVGTASKYISDEGYTFPVYYDTTLSAADAYGVKAFPTTVFISADGDVIKTYEGTMNAAQLEYYIGLIR
jgi:thiol-disulfide isomerase/thioredoxin